MLQAMDRESQVLYKNHFYEFSVHKKDHSHR